ncbi:MAG: non-canonical purine NTP pyrophosphatase, RdgB/HAM1 family [Rickettsiales bacterium]|nr:non-canonical purine NTP pyrophosphatase, RdgB/HAM1 family [Rickettsiales bacterium]|tara:strand:+ start:68 stop:676 length:609 start_codon:yes stop_codon:yes gene_type:complete
MRCVVFSNNKKKSLELQELLNKNELEVFSYGAVLGRKIEVIEDGLTFEQNAIKKVVAISQLKDDILIADDSGLEVDCLNGRPGVFSARYGGESLTDLQRCEHLLKQIEHDVNRKARFVCSIALKLPNSSIQTVQGIVEGDLSKEPKGESGFGYDPIFIPSGYDQTFAELGPLVKHSISHRSKALIQVEKIINDFLAKNLVSG